MTSRRPRQLYSKPLKKRSLCSAVGRGQKIWRNAWKSITNILKGIIRYLTKVERVTKSGYCII